MSSKSWLKLWDKFGFFYPILHIATLAPISRPAPGMRESDNLNRSIGDSVDYGERKAV